MANQTLALKAGSWLKGEAESPPLHSREQITILAGSGAERVLTSGMVLGEITKDIVSVGAAVAGNTGDGTMGAVTEAAGLKLGVYKVTFIEPATNLGSFIVEDPDGVNVGSGVVGSVFTGGGVSFTIADGATDFVAGDAFTITVSAGSGKLVQLTLAAFDGSEVAAGLLLSDATAPDGTDKAAVAIVRDATINDQAIVWPAGASAGQKVTALAELKALGIIAGEGA